MKKHSWIKISDISIEDGLDLFIQKNEVRVIVASEKEFCVSRVNDKLFALQNYCPHAGGSLGEGTLDAHNNVICPLHQYKFNLQTGRSVGEDGFVANTYPVEIRKDGIYLGVKEK